MEQVMWGNGAKLRGWGEMKGEGERVKSGG